MEKHFTQLYELMRNQHNSFKTWLLENLKNLLILYGNVKLTPKWTTFSTGKIWLIEISIKDNLLILIGKNTLNETKYIQESKLNILDLEYIYYLIYEKYNN